MLDPKACSDDITSEGDKAGSASSDAASARPAAEPAEGAAAPRWSTKPCSCVSRAESCALVEASRPCICPVSSVRASANSLIWPVVVPSKARRAESMLAFQLLLASSKEGRRILSCCSVSEATVRAWLEAAAAACMEADISVCFSAWKVAGIGQVDRG